MLAVPVVKMFAPFLPCFNGLEGMPFSSSCCGIFSIRLRSSSSYDPVVEVAAEVAAVKLG